MGRQRPQLSLDAHASIASYRTAVAAAKGLRYSQTGAGVERDSSGSDHFAASTYTYTNVRAKGYTTAGQSAPSSRDCPVSEHLTTGEAVQY